MSKPKRMRAMAKFYGRMSTLLCDRNTIGSYERSASIIKIFRKSPRPQNPFPVIYGKAFEFGSPTRRLAMLGLSEWHVVTCFGTRLALAEDSDQESILRASIGALHLGVVAD